jgi:hypothetical protein
VAEPPLEAVEIPALAFPQFGKGASTPGERGTTVSRATGQAAPEAAPAMPVAEAPRAPSPERVATPEAPARDAGVRNTATAASPETAATAAPVPVTVEPAPLPIVETRYGSEAPASSPGKAADPLAGAPVVETTTGGPPLMIRADGYSQPALDPLAGPDSLAPIAAAEGAGAARASVKADASRGSKATAATRRPASRLAERAFAASLKERGRARLTDAAITRILTRTLSAPARVVAPAPARARAGGVRAGGYGRRCRGS